MGARSFTYSVATSGGTATGQVSLNVNDPNGAESFGTNDMPTRSPQRRFSGAGRQFILAPTDDHRHRFYKGAANTGTHIADLWSSTGTLLAPHLHRGNGQRLAAGYFATPVSITAGTTYVAAYHTSGNYSADTNYFSSPVLNGQLTAPGGSNGVYAYGSGALFPTLSYNASNYWVDVIYSGPALLPPTAEVDSVFASQNSSLNIAASVLLANDSDPNGLPLSIASVGNPDHGTVSYNSTTRIVTFTPTPGYLGPASFGYTITDGRAALQLRPYLSRCNRLRLLQWRTTASSPARM